jgi:protocatechuate 3,4-dioxygenase alpha subunit
VTDGPAPTRPTPSQTVGPFFRFAFDWLEARPMLPSGSPDSLTIWGYVLDGAGEPVPDAVVEVYQAGPRGPTQDGWQPFGRACTDPAGRYSFMTAKPDRTDDRQAPHLDVSVFARGLLQRLWTRCYFPDEVLANASDPVLQAVPEADRVATLIAHPDPPGLRFDIRLQGDHETVFFDW